MASLTECGTHAIFAAEIGKDGEGENPDPARPVSGEAADQAELDPDRMSFIRVLRAIRRQVTGQAASPLGSWRKQSGKRLRKSPIVRINRDGKRTCPRAVKRQGHTAFPSRWPTPRDRATCVSRLGTQLE
jgi:hypothetical protein